MEKESPATTGRALEDDYFREKDRELVDRLRRAGGLTDAGLLQELHDLGFTPETVSLLPLVPAVQTAWAEGGASRATRDLMLKIARTRGIASGSAADEHLSDWLTHRPDEAVFTRANRLIGALLGAGTGSTTADVAQQAEQIAAASEPILGIGRVSAEEKALLTELSAGLKNR